MTARRDTSESHFGVEAADRLIGRSSGTTPVSGAILSAGEGLAAGARISQRVMILSIGGTWTLYIALIALRTSMIAFPHRAALIERHVMTAVAGAFLTWCLYLLLSRFADRSLSIRVAALAFVAIIPAAVLAIINYNVMFVFDPEQLWTLHYRQSINFLFIVASTITENYFLFVAWGTLYTAVESAIREQDARRQAAVFEALAREAQLRALRYQLNPHFLFNALNTISALFLEGDIQKGEQTINALSDFLRITLTMDAVEDVSLADEIRLQSLYLDIEQIRFSDRIKVEIFVPERLRSASVPPLLLQPLTENVVRHAVGRLATPVTVTIRADEAGGLLRLIVEDDAPSGPDADGHGFGLDNVQSRLAARFGKIGRCVYGPRGDSGFRVELTLPFLRG